MGLAGTMTALSIAWRDVEKGMRVEVSGRAFVVDKIKVKGKAVKVTLTGAGGTFTGEQRAGDKVTIARREVKATRKALDAGRDELHDGRGAQVRWATDGEADALEQRRGLPAGDKSVTRPPAKTRNGDSWETRRDKVEFRLDELLGARLVGEATDERVGYYIPPADASTVAAHWMVFHEGDAWQDHGEAELLRMHTIEHELVVDPDVYEAPSLKVNHWHTKARPNS